MAITTHNYAQIDTELQEVMNVIVCEDYEMANFLARAIYGEENGIAVDITEWPVGPGYKYIDGTFYEPDGETPVLPIPSPERRCEELEKENTDLQLALVEQYEENLAMQEEITNTQLALTEIYESMMEV
ncbi:MAG: hypothetical protein Q4P84_00295 [Elusimicrobiales bacterium]|nr:hypothetical protein [Elusimicrobiales bacterium]